MLARCALRVSILFVGLVAFETPARATDKAGCAAAAEEGQRLKKEHKLVAAREQLLVCSSKDCPDIVSQDCTQWLGEVDRGVASVIFKTVDETGKPLDGARVTENGVVLAEHAGIAVDVDPGPHDFHFERPGYAPVEQRAQLDEGRRNQEVAVTMHPIVTTPVVAAERPSHGGTTGLLVAAVTASTLAVAGGAIFAGFGLSGLSDQDALRKTCAPYCTSAQRLRIQTKLTIADVALVAGIVALAAAGVFWIVWGTSHAPSKHVSVGLGGAGFAF